MFLAGNVLDFLQRGLEIFQWLTAAA